MPANRTATDRTQSVRPLFSWMTRMTPLAFGASDHAACSWPCGPVHVIALVGSALADPGGAEGDVAGPLDVTGAFDVVFLFSPHAAINAVAAAVLTPSN